ncbi:hypothetical protein A9R01_16490, partial ['Osedax' symbiont bacterium Rs2_46_30_T18]
AGDDAQLKLLNTKNKVALQSLYIYLLSLPSIVLTTLEARYLYDSWQFRGLYIRQPRFKTQILVAVS